MRIKKLVIEPVIAGVQIVAAGSGIQGKDAGTGWRGLRPTEATGSL
jgi:hypothetical protein